MDDLGRYRYYPLAAVSNFPDLQSFRLNFDKPVAGDAKTIEFENVTTLPVGCWVRVSISFSWNCNQPISVTSPLTPEIWT